jgi:DNA-binding NarL/FixJ family response regulator
MSVAPIRVAIIDDVAAIRELLRHRLPFEGDFEVVAEGESAEEAIAIARAGGVDLMILDVVMPGMTGVAALPAIRAATRTCKVVLYTAVDGLTSRHPRSIGADACIDKTESYARLSEVLGELFPEATASSAAASPARPEVLRSQR